MQYDVLIVGQGLSGTILGHNLEQMGKSVAFIDGGHLHSSSKVAAGIINPVTGRNYVKSWLIDELLPIALDTYEQLEQKFGIQFCNKLPIIRSLNFAAQENLWFAKSNDPEYAKYISSEVTRDEVDDFVHPAFSYGLVHEAYQIDLPKLLKTYRDYLLTDNRLIQSTLSYDELVVNDTGVEFRELKASKIIFAEGWQGSKNPYFLNEPFNLVKGEMLLVKIKNGFKFNLRHNIFFTPIGNDIYWCGSNYDRDYKTIEPTEVRLERMKAFLKDIIKVPYEIIDHKAGIRPATIDRTPIIKQHTDYSQMYMFNGMGAKGSSLAPYFARQFCETLF